MANPSPLVPAEDPLWVALVRVLSFYKVRPQKELIEAQVAVDWSQPLAPKDLMLIAHQLGFEVVVQSMGGIDIKGLLKPALIMMPPGVQFVVTVPQENGDPDIWSPDPVDIDGLLASTQRNLYAMQFGRRFAVASDDEATEASKTIAPWFWNIVWQHNRDYLDLGLATFFVNIIALVSPLFSMNVFDRVVPNHANETLFALTIGIVLAYIFNFGFKYIRDHILGIITTRIAVRLDIDFMDQLLRLSVPAHKQTVGEKFDLFHEMQGLRDFFAARLMPAIVDMPFFVLFLGVMFLIAPPVGVIVLIGVILLVVVNLALQPAVKRTAKAHYKDTRSKNAALVELISGASSIRMFNAIGFTLFRWGNLSERVAGSSRTSSAKTSLADDLSAMIMYLTSVFVIVAGVLSIESGDLSLGGLVACNMLVGRTMAPVMGLIAVFGRLRQSLDSLKTIDAIFHLPAEPKLALDYETKGPFKGRMRFDDITFYHPGQVHPTLYHLSLDIRPGEKVGLIGRTGAGKSTLLGLLDGSIKPQSGHVFADEIIMDAIHPTEWRQSLGLVPQNPFIFSGTVRENILLGLKDNVEDAWLKQVLSMAGLDVLLQSAGYGLDFKVGEAGIRLSGGQRQSLALARALIRRPKILLMDEPTNGMDNDLEQRVMNNLRGYLADKTMMMVTHRTPLLALVDRLVLIDQGRVVADGPRDDVMRKLSGTAHG